MRCRKILLSAVMVWTTICLAACGSSQSDKESSSVQDLNKLEEIHVIAREEGSGTRSAFAGLVGFEGDGQDDAKSDLTREDATIVNSADEVIEMVQADASAIGYLSEGSLVDIKDVKVLSVNGAAADDLNSPYALSRSFYLAYCGKLSDLEQDFLTYVHGAGQEIVGKNYVAIAKSSTFLSNQAEGKINIAGSTSAAPLVEELAEAYMGINPHAQITVTATDSADGLTQAMSGTCDLGMSSRDLKDYEAELLDYEIIAEDNIAVIVEKDNPLDDISLDSLKDIYTGEIDYWEELNE